MHNSHRQITERPESVHKQIIDLQKKKKAGVLIETEGSGIC